MKKITLIVIALLSFASVATAIDSLPDVESFYSSYLTTFISSSATTITVASAPNVSSGLLVIEPRTSKKEIVYMISRSGTTLTVRRGLATYGSSTATSTNGVAHGAGSSIEMADVHYYTKLLQDIVMGSTSTPGMLITSATTTNLVSTNATVTNLTVTSATTTNLSVTTINGGPTFSSIPSTSVTPTSGNQLTNKTYVDNVAGVAAVANASTTVKGISQEATVAEINSGTATGTTGARLFINPSTLLLSNQYIYAPRSYNAIGTTTLSVLIGSERPTVDIWADTIVNAEGGASFSFIVNGITIKSFSPFSGYYTSSFGIQYSTTTLPAGTTTIQLTGGNVSATSILLKTYGTN